MITSFIKYFFFFNGAFKASVLVRLLCHFSRHEEQEEERAHLRVHSKYSRKGLCLPRLFIWLSQIPTNLSYR